MHLFRQLKQSGDKPTSSEEVSEIPILKGIVSTASRQLVALRSLAVCGQMLTLGFISASQVLASYCWH